MDAMIQRFTQLLWEEATLCVSDAEALYQALIPGQTPDTWRWPDLDYADQKRTSWSAAEHCYRLQNVLSSLGESRLRTDPIYASRMTGALKYWTDHDFENPNWWYNQIGIPQAVGNIALLLRPWLDDRTLSGAVAILEKGSMATNMAIGQSWTGANVIWGMLNTLRHALLTGNEPLLAAAAQRAAQEVTFGEKTGIQTDYSFFQHGTRLYTGGYGRSFADTLCWLMFVLQDTPYQLPEEVRDRLLGLVLEGLQPLTQGDVLDWACVGREISRPDATKVGTIERTLKRMLRTKELSRKPELQAYLDTIQGAPAPDQTRYFEKAAMLCHRFHGIYVGAKFMNDRIFGTETCDAEGILCYNLSYGTHTCIMRTGKEYLNINPIWDYSRIPGTTCATETDQQLLAHENWWKQPLLSGTFGGGQDGHRGILYELAEHDGITVLAADFAFEDGFVCLGANVKNQNDPSQPPVTTVDQCFLSGTVLEEQGHVLHNGIRYSGLDGTVIHAESQLRHGNWQRNNAGLSDETVSAEVLTLTIHQGSSATGSYAYLLCAGDRPAPQVQVLRNDDQIQAIGLPDGSIMAIFHKDGCLRANGKQLSGTAGQLFYS